MNLYIIKALIFLLSIFLLGNQLNVNLWLQLTRFKFLELTTINLYTMEFSYRNIMKHFHQIKWIIGIAIVPLHKNYILYPSAIWPTCKLLYTLKDSYINSAKQPWKRVVILHHIVIHGGERYICQTLPDDGRVDRFHLTLFAFMC